MRYAAENGFDRIAWVTGDQSEDRYNLAKHVKSIEYAKHDDGRYSLYIKGLYGSDIKHAPDKYTPEQLEDFVGKDVAKRIVGGEGERNPDTGYNSLSGVDLTIAGEGMKGIYDQIVSA